MQHVQLLSVITTIYPVMSFENNYINCMHFNFENMRFMIIVHRMRFTNRPSLGSASYSGSPCIQGTHSVRSCFYLHTLAEIRGIPGGRPRLCRLILSSYPSLGLKNKFDPYFTIWFIVIKTRPQNAILNLLFIINFFIW